MRQQGANQRPEVSRGIARLNGQRGSGGEVPTMVSIVDNMTLGPFFPCDVWEFSVVGGAVVGQYDILSLRPPGAGSVLVIDLIKWRTSIAARLVYGVITDAAAETFGLTVALATAVTPRSKLDNNQLVGHALYRGISSAALPGTDVIIPGPDALGHTHDGPWVVNPGFVMYFRQDTVNNDLEFYAKGRTYTAP